MWRAGCSRGRGDAGFTLIELLSVVALVAMVFVAAASAYRAPSQGLEVRTAASVIGSRLRDLRAAAITLGDERLAIFDVDGRTVSFSDGRAPLTLSPKLTLSVVGAESEMRGGRQAGVRFFPNGSSSGATIKVNAERQSYEVRVNWLTGRVRVAAAD